MIRQIRDPDVQLLASLAATIASEYTPVADDPWLGSPFEWIRKELSRTRGAIGERLIAGWCVAKGFDVLRSPDVQTDRIVNGYRLEIKFSTMWKNGQYAFQQIRDQQYDDVFCLGISPFGAQAWLLPKSVLKQYVIGHTGQHTGASAGDTAWLRFPFSNPPAWMAPYGGRLRDVEKLIARGRDNH